MVLSRGKRRILTAQSLLHPRCLPAARPGSRLCHTGGRDGAGFPPPAGGLGLWWCGPSLTGQQGSQRGGVHVVGIETPELLGEELVDVSPLERDRSARLARDRVRRRLAVLASDDDVAARSLQHHRRDT